MKQLNVIKCLVISPQDVQAEREAVSTVFERWNGQIGSTLNTLIHAVRWETHSSPELGGSPQAVLNKQIVNDCDCAVAVFWSRLGTPTEKATSGSIEEINEIDSKGGHVLVYVCKRDIPQTLIDPEQLGKLKTALETFRKKGIVFEYRSLEELQMLLIGHLTPTANKILAAYSITPQKKKNTVHANANPRSELPDVRVTVTWGLPTGIGPYAPSLLCVEVQNHSAQSVFFKSIAIELSNGQELAPRADAFGASIPGRTKLDSGSSLPFYLDFASILQSASKAGELKLRRCVITDQINRKFYSSEEAMEIAVSNYKKWIGS
jgi:hypothetical protein